MGLPRPDVALSVLALADGAKLSPTQLQKALYLIVRNAPSVFAEGQAYHFVPYNYGPFDSTVYADIDRLKLSGKAEIARGRWNEYSATPIGIEEGKHTLSTLPVPQQEYMKRVVDWVKSLSFQQLVKAIYDAYPEMRVNSIFKG